MPDDPALQHEIRPSESAVRPQEGADEGGRSSTAMTRAPAVSIGPVRAPSPASTSTEVAAFHWFSGGQGVSD